ncbi:acetylglutamate/acetylaminoadipate kinase [Halolamina salifodinae]|uniref:Putative [LysW]-aminoadipate/[LysW]-glutamate kinase n=1 Tax=Halolamina salifodinae TaxID=1202767 RepID=A0A8T4H257_9EURY|nr:acetylglutamate/acetylaminoadipate kinase [Halolamina salifodinae]MBP1987368.1 acetylglutamate/LysW-gamma-L-alpha-aminoadipate kinase [Halolamina salifodinae]
MSESNAAVGPDQPPVVVKIGGARAVDPAGVIEDVAHIAAAGREVVVVHGGSTAVDDTLEAMGTEPEYVETPAGVSGRFTDEETMEVFSMVLPGKLNTDLVTDLRTAGVNAVGLSGIDGGLITGPRKSAVRVLEDGKKKIRRGDHAGKPESVNVDLLASLLADGYVPTVSPPMLADDGTAANADADRVAALLAAELGAELVLLTDVAGVYEDPDDPDTLIDTAATPSEFEALEAAAEGFMSRKVHAAKEALTGGAAGVIVSDATLRKPLLAALEGHGTWIAKDAVAEIGGEA